MAEQLVISNDPAIVVPGGMTALYEPKPFPVRVNEGEFYFVPEKCDLEPRVRTATLLALLGESNKRISALTPTSEYTAKRDVLKAVHHFGLTDRFALPYHAFANQICQRTKDISPYEGLLPRMVQVIEALAQEGMTDSAAKTHIVPRTVGTYQNQVSKRTGVRGGRNRLVLMGIMSNQIGNFKTVAPETILAPK